jgi:hypothetical protein
VDSISDRDIHGCGINLCERMDIANGIVSDYPNSKLSVRKKDEKQSWILKTLVLSRASNYRRLEWRVKRLNLISIAHLQYHRCQQISARAQGCKLYFDYLELSWISDRRVLKYRHHGLYKVIKLWSVDTENSMWWMDLTFLKFWENSNQHGRGSKA